MDSKNVERLEESHSEETKH